ncbi:OLD family ATP-dependent endonuclease [Klebsiella pneumoniae subsp. rhinoscleromatis]|nr:OLD family ATP-dependent endonuclease [Klebsiella pneumoniae subsp. rhinoscleromatis]
MRRGKKYAATVRGLLNNDRELERDHLTSLPALDMEHFMYRQGFDDVYHRVAQIPDNVPMNMRRVITKAIHRSSKPDLAIEVAMEAGRRGVDAVPDAAEENVLTGAVASPRSCRLISPPSSFTAA